MPSAVATVAFAIACLWSFVADSGAAPQTPAAPQRRLGRVAFIPHAPRASHRAAASSRCSVPVAMDLAGPRGRVSARSAMPGQCPPPLRHGRAGDPGALLPVRGPWFGAGGAAGRPLVALWSARSGGGRGREESASMGSEEDEAEDEDFDDEDEEDDEEFDDDEDDDEFDETSDFTDEDDPTEELPDDDDEDDEFDDDEDFSGEAVSGEWTGPEDYTGEGGRGTFDKEFTSLSKSEIVSEVQEMYEDVGDYSRDERLIRARVEMRQEELGLDMDDVNIDAEIQKMLDFERQKKEKAGKVQQGGIPGEISQGPPEMSPVALYERAHDLHLQLSRTPIFDKGRFSVGHDILETAEKDKQFLNADELKNLTTSGKINDLQAKVALTLLECSYSIMQSAPKAAEAEMPGLTAPGGAFHASTIAIGDLFPGMLVRLFMRHIQYGIILNEVNWTSEEGLGVFGELMCELGSPTEAVLLLLRRTEEEICDKHLSSDAERALVQRQFEMVLGSIPPAVREAKAKVVPIGNVRQRPDWEEIWDTVPLKEFWDDPDLPDLPEYYEQLKAEKMAEAAENGEEQDSDHPLENPVEWRKWVENTAWEDAKEKPIPIEEIFANMQINLPGEINSRWLMAAGVLNEEGELVKKVERLYTQEDELTWFGPRYSKKKKRDKQDGAAEGGEGGEEGDGGDDGVRAARSGDDDDDDAIDPRAAYKVVDLDSDDDDQA